jgi:transcriptional regulator with XRE-family HTH domain
MKKKPLELGQRIRQFRQERRISQSEMARRIDIAGQQYNRYELEKTKIPIEVLLRVADVLEVGPEVLLERKAAQKGGTLVEDLVFYNLVYKIRNCRRKEYREEELQILTSMAKVLADRLEEKKKKQPKATTF